MKTGENFSGISSEDKRQWYAEDIKNCMFFEKKWIKNMKKYKKKGNTEKGKGNNKSSDETEKTKQKSHFGSPVNGKYAWGERPVFFKRMKTVEFEIDDVIEEIGWGGQGTKDKKADSSHPEIIGIKKFSGENNGSKKNEIFNPLIWS